MIQPLPHQWGIRREPCMGFLAAVKPANVFVFWRANLELSLRAESRLNKNKVGCLGIGNSRTFCRHFSHHRPEMRCREAVPENMEVCSSSLDHLWASLWSACMVNELMCWVFWWDIFTNLAQGPVPKSHSVSSGRLLVSGWWLLTKHSFLFHLFTW